MSTLCYYDASSRQYCFDVISKQPQVLNDASWHAYHNMIHSVTCSSKHVLRRRAHSFQFGRGSIPLADNGLLY